MTAGFFGLLPAFYVAACTAQRPRHEVWREQLLLPFVLGIAAVGLSLWVYLLSPQMPVPAIKPEFMPADLRWARVDATAQSVALFGWLLGSLWLGAAFAIQRVWMRAAVFGAVCGGAAGVLIGMWSWWFWPGDVFEMHVSGFMSRELGGLIVGAPVGLHLPLLRRIAVLLVR